MQVEGAFESHCVSNVRGATEMPLGRGLSRNAYDVAGDAADDDFDNDCDDDDDVDDNENGDLDDGVDDAGDVMVMTMIHMMNSKKEKNNGDADGVNSDNYY